MRTTNFMMGGVLAIFFAYSTGGCPTPAPKPPPVDASDGAAITTCERACANLQRLGCPEAATPDGGKSCVRLCEDAEASGKFSLKPACVADAKSAQDVRACGTVRCP